MASKKKGQLSKYCRIFQFVEANDADLAQAIRDLCMEGALAARGAGVTLLYPAEKGYRAEIVDKAYTDEAEEAVHLLESLIIPMAVRSASDFRSGVGSKLGVKLEVEKVEGSKVFLKGGAVLKPSTSFRPLGTKASEKMAVWVVESGRVPTSGEKFELPAHHKKGGKGYRGGASGGAGGGHSRRCAIADDVEKEFDRCMREGSCRSKNPYLAKSVSLLHFLKIRYPDLLCLVCPIIDRDPAVTFYLLLEPFKAIGPCLLPDEVIAGWDGAESYEDAVAEYREYFESKSDAKYSSDPAGVRSAVDGLRQRIGASLNKINTPTAIRAAYQTLETQNQIGGMGPILPEATLRALQGCKKVWQDELRFLLHAQLTEVLTAPSYEPGEYAAIVYMLRVDRPGNDYHAELTLANPGLYGGNGRTGDIAPNDRFGMLVTFLNSTDFLYTPVPRANIGTAWATFAGYDPRTGKIYNAEASKEQVLEMHSLMVRTGLPPSVAFAVQNYLARHGSLPPELQGAAASAAAPAAEQ